MLHNTISRNYAGDGTGIYIYSGGTKHNSVSLTNTIIVSHSVGISITSGDILTLNGVLWHQTPVTISQGITAVVSAQNQYSGDPAFGGDGYHLTNQSAAIDK